MGCLLPKTKIYIFILRVNTRVPEEITSSIVKRYANGEGRHLLTGWHCLITQNLGTNFCDSKELELSHWTHRPCLRGGKSILRSDIPVVYIRTTVDQ
jgi:hypothetical protein